MSLTDPIPDHYYTRSEDDYDFLYPDINLDEAYDFFRMGEEDYIEEEVEEKDEKEN